MGLNPVTILVVEDEPSVLAITQITLERDGYHVLAAASAQSATALAIQHVNSIGLLLLDVIMPELSGPQLRERLQVYLNNPGIPTIYMSGYPDVHWKEDLELLQKPFTAGQLLKSVRQALCAEPKRLDGAHPGRRRETFF